MKKGQVYEGSVVRVDFPNKGIVCVGDETAVVKNSLPGQKVKFSVNAADVPICLFPMKNS